MSVTHAAVSEDSGQIWTESGAFPVATGVWRIPLPLPMDGLRAVNVYVLDTPDGLTLIDGGWAIDVSRRELKQGLETLGWGLSDITAFLVTHVHRDHYTQAVALRAETGAHITLGLEEKASLDTLTTGSDAGEDPRLTILTEAGAGDLAREWDKLRATSRTNPDLWQFPDDWLAGDRKLQVGPHNLDAIHTPGHTRGHYVFRNDAEGLLFAGDHVLPTITPSIGFETEPPPQPLGDFLASLTKVRRLPDTRLLPAHGPVVSSVHQRVDELLAHHEERLQQSLDCLDHSGNGALEVGEQLSWTGRRRRFSELDVSNQVLATLETRAHLEVLTAQGQAVSWRDEGLVKYALPDA